MKQAILLCLLVSTLVNQVSWAQIPQTISYQGVLTDELGILIADGNHELTFMIYDIDEGGPALWSETHLSVAVVDGVFNVILGSVVPLNIPFDIP